jgi:hypothetical protein
MGHAQCLLHMHAHTHTALGCVAYSFKYGYENTWEDYCSVEEYEENIISDRSSDIRQVLHLQ